MASGISTVENEIFCMTEYAVDRNNSSGRRKSASAQRRGNLEFDLITFEVHIAFAY